MILVDNLYYSPISNLIIEYAGYSSGEEYRGKVYLGKIKIHEDMSQPFFVIFQKDNNEVLIQGFQESVDGEIYRIFTNNDWNTLDCIILNLADLPRFRESYRNFDITKGLLNMLNYLLRKYSKEKIPTTDFEKLLEVESATFNSTNDYYNSAVLSRIQDIVRESSGDIPDKKEIMDWIGNSLEIYYQPSRARKQDNIRKFIADDKVSSLKEEIENRYPPLLPDIDSINLAVSLGRSEIVQYLIEKYHLFPTVKSVNEALLHHHYDIINYLAKNYNIFPNVEATVLAAKAKDMNVLTYLYQMNPPILPNTEAVNAAAANGNVELLQIMSKLTPPILPDIRGASKAAENGEYEVLSLLASFNPPIFPSKNAIAIAEVNGYTRIVDAFSMSALPYY